MPENPPQPTLTDGVVTLRPWRDEDLEVAAARHDEEIAQGFRLPAADGGSRVSFLVEAPDGSVAGNVEVQDHQDGLGRLSWALYAGQRGHGYATRAVRLLVDYAFTQLGLQRLEAHVDPRNTRSIRVATRSGLHREGIRRVVPGMADVADATSVVVLARLVTDPPVSEPESFRALLNSFLPRKRAIGQMLIRDTEDRVLLCQLTYKRDWDLPGGVVEVGESPRLAVSREVAEELALEIEAGDLLLTDWLPPWSGWDDAICLVFDGGVHDPSITDGIVEEAREIRSAEWCTPEQVHERCADFTARRIDAAFRDLADGVARYTESGR